MKLLEQCQIVARRRRMAKNTIEAYLLWVRHFVTFSAARLGDWRHPVNLGTADVEAFLNDLVLRKGLSASSQNQAMCALVFLYTHVLEDVIPNDHLGKFLLMRSRRPTRLPTVLLGHASLKTTMIYAHVTHRPAIAVASPLDRLTAPEPALMT